MAVDIKQFTTMKIGGLVARLSKITKSEDIPALVEKAKESGLKFFVLGEGSNTVFRDKEHQLLVGKMEIKDLKNRSNLLLAGAGENWDKLVSWSVVHGLSGLESLSGIPGTVGAAPIQNIGAYGSEIFRVLKYVEAYDIYKKEFVLLQNKELKFKYRDSFFKQNPGRFVVLKVALRLNKNQFPGIPNYKEVLTYFESRNLKSPNIQEIRDAILEIRKTKLPDPSIIPNCGSFFKNPVVHSSIALKLKSKYENLPIFPVDTKQSKISAGWLLEQAEFKGYNLGHVGTYKNNALVLINKGDATFAELDKLRNLIKQKILYIFGIQLEEEVNII